MQPARPMRIHATAPSRADCPQARPELSFSCRRQGTRPISRPFRLISRDLPGTAPGASSGLTSLASARQRSCTGAFGDWGAGGSASRAPPRDDVLVASAATGVPADLSRTAGTARSRRRRGRGYRGSRANHGGRGVDPAKVRGVAKIVALGQLGQARHLAIVAALDRLADHDISPAVPSSGADDVRLPKNAADRSGVSRRDRRRYS